MNDTYLKEAVDRMLAGILALTDDNGNHYVKHIQAYMLPPPTKHPAMTANINALQTQRADAGNPWDTQTYRITLRLATGLVNQKYEGRIYEDLFTWVPRIVNYLQRHPDLIFSEGQSEIAELSPDGIQVIGTGALGPKQDGTVGIDFLVEVPFHIEIEEVYY